MISVESTIHVLEIDGEPSAVARLLVSSHPVHNEWVVVRLSNQNGIRGEAITVLGSDLKSAIANAMNTGDKYT